jgi:hypothetical protein
MVEIKNFWQWFILYALFRTASFSAYFSSRINKNFWMLCLLGSDFRIGLNKKKSWMDPCLQPKNIVLIIAFFSSSQCASGWLRRKSGSKGWTHWNQQRRTSFCSRKEQPAHFFLMSQSPRIWSNPILTFFWSRNSPTRIRSNQIRIRLATYNSSSQSQSQNFAG